MKILEAQSATLTNYEVYTHLTEQRARYEARVPKRRGPGNLETIVKEMFEYLRSAPSPLGCKPLPYDPNTIKTLIERLRPYDLAKAEVLMILNLRPTQVSGLVIIVEDLEERFPDPDAQQQIADAIAEVLGKPDDEAERLAMTESAKGARERQVEAEAREQEDIEMEGVS